MMRRRSTRDPRIPSSAGSRVTADSTEKTTTKAPPRPIVWSAVKGKNTSPRMPMATAMPLKNTERPAWATVDCTASATEAPAASSSRKRATMNSA
jgi:hypothetical protein